MSEVVSRMSKPKSWDVEASREARSVIVSCKSSMSELARFGGVSMQTLARLVAGEVVSEYVARRAIGVCKKAEALRGV